MLNSKALILAKIETTYGTDPVPVIGANEIVTSIPVFEVLGSVRKRNVVKLSFGELPDVKVGEGLKITFEVELRGSGTAGTVPQIGVLLRACNLTETISVGVSVTYAPNSSHDGESISIYFYADGRLHKMSGCRGTFKLLPPVNDIIKMQFDFQGIYSSTHASDVAFPTPTFVDTVAQIISRGITGTINGYSAIITAYDFDLGNNIGRRVDANSATGVKAYSIMERVTKATAKLEMPSFATFNPWTLWDASTQFTTTWLNGSVAGNKVTWNLNRCQLTDVPKYSAEQTIKTIDLTLHPNVTLGTGNDDLSIVFT